MIITKNDISKLAGDIMKFLSAYRITDVSIFFNNIRIDKGILDTAHSAETCPLYYFENVNRHHILSMSFDGSDLCSALYDDTPIREEFSNILERYGLYYELGNVWNLSVYPINDDTIVEYTDYTGVDARLLYSGNI